MKKFTLLLAGLALSSGTFAAPPTYLELAYITGGENNDRGAGGGEKDGFEFAGSWGFNENWYAGGAIGSYDRADADYDYININGGYSQSLNEKLSMNLEGGLWFGERDQPGGNDPEPSAIEAKVGLSTMLTDKLAWPAHSA